MAPDGEFIMLELSGSSEVGGTVRFLYGTGKWKGIKGEFKVKRLTTGKPITQGTDQHCEKHEGWFELPKWAFTRLKEKPRLINSNLLEEVMRGNFRKMPI